MAATVLVIEDNQDNLNLVRFLLERVNLNVIEAYDGLTGFDIALKDQPNLILVDLGIPGMDGWELTKRLKDDDRTRHIIVVALSAHTRPADRKRALESGCDAYLTKPLDVATFQNTIVDYLK